MKETVYSTVVDATVAKNVYSTVVDVTVAKTVYSTIVDNYRENCLFDSC